MRAGRSRKAECHEEVEIIRDRGNVTKFVNKVFKETKVAKPVCEGGKAVGDLICNTVQVLSKAACDAGEELKKAGCEGNKIFVDKVLGRVGRISGDYTVGGVFSITLDNAHITSDLRKVDATFTGKASAKVNGTLKFIPMDQGHLLVCIAEWKEPFSVSASIPEARRSASATLSGSDYVEDKDTKGLKLRYSVESFSLAGNVSPSPFDAVFNQHPHLPAELPISIPDW